MVVKRNVERPKTLDYQTKQELNAIVTDTLAKETGYPVELDDLKLTKEQNKTIEYSKEKMDERNDYMLGLYLMGISADSIMKTVNARQVTEGWKRIINIGEVYHVVSLLAAKRIPDGINKKNHLDGLKEAAFAQQEYLLEKGMRFLQSKKDAEWKPFELITSLEKLFTMRQQVIENRNWNESRMNPMVAINNTFTQLATFEDNRTENIIVMKESGALDKLKSRLSEKFGEKTNQE